MKTNVTPIRVRYAETDQMGVVYNAHFLTYFEVGRTEYLRAAGFRYRELEDRGVHLVVTEAHCRYIAPARYDDVVEVTTWVDRMRPTRIDFRHRIVRGEDGAALAEGHLVLACLDENGRPQGIPAEVRGAIEVTAQPEA